MRILVRLRCPVFALVLVASALAMNTALFAAGLYTGDCELTADPNDPTVDSMFDACVRANAGAELSLTAGSPRSSAWMNYGQSTVSLFINSYLSVAGRAFWRHVVPLGRYATEVKDYETDYAVLQLGNPVIDHVRATLGRMRLPFGIDLTSAPQFYQLQENRNFWDSPHDSMILTLDDMRRFRFEIGTATNDVDRRRAEHPGEIGQETDNAVSVRTSVDVSALEGTRLVASGYTAKGGERRYGAGIINQDHRGNQTSGEFVRMLTTPDGREAPFKQLLRLAFVSAFHQDGRWIVQYDDQAGNNRRGVVDHEQRLFGHFLLRTGITYTESLQDAHDLWSVVFGTEAEL